jgi:hypothetical protein
MQCEICEGHRFVDATYRSRDAACPALSCVECGAIVLAEEIARGSEERSSVRIAMARRAMLALDAPFIFDPARAGLARWNGS